MSGLAEDKPWEPPFHQQPGSAMASTRSLPSFQLVHSEVPGIASTPRWVTACTDR